MLINPHTGQPMQTQPEEVYIFNPKTDVTVDELAEILMLVLSAQRFAITNTDMLRESSRRHFDKVAVQQGAANQEMGVGDSAAAGKPSIGTA